MARNRLPESDCAYTEWMQGRAMIAAAPRAKATIRAAAATANESP